MAIKIKCSKCEAKFSVKDAAAGRRVKCRECAAPIKVPRGQPIPAPKKKADHGDSFQDGLEEAMAAGSPPDSDADELFQAALPPKKKAKRKRSRSAKQPEKREKTKWTVANGLRCVLAALLLQVIAAFVVFVPYVGLIALPCVLVAPVVAFIGQVMCLKAPKDADISLFIYGVLALQALGFALRLGGFVAPVLIMVAMFTSVASFFLFVYALKRLAVFTGSRNGEMHADSIFYWGAGLVVLRTVPIRVAGMLGPAMFDPMMVIVGIAALVIIVMILCRYIDLLGCLKDDLKEV
ncbi:MAG: hypothetical protein ABGZ53_26595 [Fuerstiella sp.]